MKPRPTFLYCIELVGAPIAKIGIAMNPMARLTVIAASCPFETRFRRVFSFPDAEEAALEERHIIHNANSHRERGEWVRCDEALDALLSTCRGKDVSDEFGIEVRKGRRRRVTYMAGKRRLDLRRQVGIKPAAVVEYGGGEGTYEAAVIRARLADGYGVEDILAMDGIPLETSRAVIFNLEKSGKLVPLLRACRHRQAAE